MRVIYSVVLLAMLLSSIAIAVLQLAKIANGRTQSETASWIALSIVLIGFIIILFAVALRIGLFPAVRYMVPKRRYFNDPHEVYEYVLNRVMTTSQSGQKRLDVLGVTLHLAWPNLNLVVQQPSLNDWHISFSALAMGDDTSVCQAVSDDWYLDSIANLSQIHRRSGEQDLLDRNIKLTAYSYNFLPALHGFRFANGDLIYSILTWGDDGLLSLDGYKYELVTMSDQSDSAVQLRRMFESWFERSKHLSWDANVRNLAMYEWDRSRSQ